MTPPGVEPAQPPFKSLAYAGSRSGPRLIVVGAVHGDETCGTRAIERLVAELDRGALQVQAGRLTLVPVANPKAYALGRRAGDRNLNRKLAPTDSPVQFEDHVANWLCPLLAGNDVLLDLHSFRNPGAPFVFLGPENNDGALQPFARAGLEEALALRLGVGRVVDGWLETYAAGVARRQGLAHRFPGAALDLDPRYGVGTTEYMRSTGGAALTLECGRHDDPQAPGVGYRAIVATLAHLGLVDAPDPAPAEGIEAMSLVAVFDRLDAGDAFSREWRSFDPVRRGEAVARRHDGESIVAADDGWIVFPNVAAAPGQEWFYLARPSLRFATA